MNRQSRIKLLKRIVAKKTSLEPLKGKKSKKDIQKAYMAAKKMYDSVAEDLRKAKEQVTKLQSFVDENEAKEKSARDTMKRCSDVLRNMDFACADAVRFSNDDVAYSIDGRWNRYNVETHELEPWKKKEKQDVQDVQEPEINPVPEDPAYEGTDITKE